jgi:oligosaccharyltransferase complex subunit alpha (ribophorin I)
VYSVQVSEPSPTLKVVGVFTSLLEPYPAEITQLENQFVRIKDSHYFYSPYKTETQRTTIKLASSTVESFTKLSPFSNKGSNLVFGPYKEIQPFEVNFIFKINT